MPWYVARVERVNGVEQVIFHPKLRPIRALAEQKLALLKAAPVGAKIEELGWRRTEDIFYLRIFKHEIKPTLGENHD